LQCDISDHNSICILRTHSRKYYLIHSGNAIKVIKRAPHPAAVVVEGIDERSIPNDPNAHTHQIIGCLWNPVKPQLEFPPRNKIELLEVLLVAVD
jgi:hypothetical protein